MKNMNDDEQAFYNSAYCDGLLRAIEIIENKSSFVLFSAKNALADVKNEIISLIFSIRNEQDKKEDEQNA